MKNILYYHCEFRWTCVEDTISARLLIMRKVAFDILRHFCNKFGFVITNVDITHTDELDMDEFKNCNLVECTFNRLPKNRREKKAYYNKLLTRMAKYGYLVIIK